MKTNHVTNTGSVQTDSLPSVNSLSTDNLRATLTRNRQTVAGSNSPLFKLLLPAILVFVLATCSTTTLKADGRDEEGYIHKPKLVLGEEYYREGLDAEHQNMYGRPGDPNNPGDPMFFFNPDSVMVDVNWGECDGTYQPYVGVMPPVPNLPKGFKNGVEVSFAGNVIPRPKIYEDNRVIRYTIDDILPKYKETIEGFKNLEKIFGTFHFEDRGTMFPDTSEYIPGEQARGPRALVIVFSNYVLDVNYGALLGGQYSLYGLIDVMKALERIEFVHPRGVTMNFGGHNEIFTDFMDIKENLLSLFVSPMVTSDNITLSLPDALIIFPKSIQIVDSTGKVVKLFSTGVDTQQVIDVSNLPAGRYFVRIENYVGSFIVR